MDHFKVHGGICTQLMPTSFNFRIGLRSLRKNSARDALHSASQFTHYVVDQTNYEARGPEEPIQMDKATRQFLQFQPA